MFLKYDRSSILRYGEPPVAAGKGRIELDCVRKELLRESGVVRTEHAQMPQTALIGGPGIQGSGRLAYGASKLSVGNSRRNGNRHRLGDLVLHREDVRDITVVALRPDMIAGLRLDQLRGNANAVARFSQTTFEDISHAEFAPDFLHVDGAALVGE